MAQLAPPAAAHPAPLCPLAHPCTHPPTTPHTRAGMALGTGSALAHRAVDAVLGSRHPEPAQATAAAQELVRDNAPCSEQVGLRRLRVVYSKIAQLGRLGRVGS